MSKILRLLKTVDQIQSNAQQAIINWCANRSLTQLRITALAIAIFSGFTAPVTAQSANRAASMMCQTGIGDLIAIGSGLLTVGLIVLAGFRGVLAWQKMGSARSDKKKEGREALKGAVITLAGAFFFPLFAAVLDRVGINTLSCVNWANVL